jgi:hypothetical protein
VLRVEVSRLDHSVSPSQRPIESPNHFAGPEGGCVPFMRITRGVVHHLGEDHTVSLLCTMV